MKDTDYHFWVTDVIKRLPIELLPKVPSWSSLLNAITQLKTERDDAITEAERLKDVIKETIEESLDLADGEINKVNETSPANKMSDVERVVMLPHLVNRGDGVDGHYCICRIHPEGYRETWNEEQKKWCSAGTVFKLGKQHNGHVRRCERDKL